MQYEGITLIRDIHFSSCYCVVPENIHTPTTEGIGNSEVVGGQRPRKFWRGVGLNDHIGFQMPFDSIRVQKSFLTH